MSQAREETREGITPLQHAAAGMDHTTRSNAALAGQSASAAQEMQTQAAQVRSAVGDLMRMVNGSVQKTVTASVARVAPVKHTPKHSAPIKPKLKSTHPAASAKYQVIKRH